MGLNESCNFNLYILATSLYQNIINCAKCFYKLSYYNNGLRIIQRGCDMPRINIYNFFLMQKNGIE